MTDVSLQIDGLNGTLVSTSSTGPWSASITVNSLTVPAGAVRDTADLHFKAPAAPQPVYTTLVNVRVKGWKANPPELLDGGSTGRAVGNNWATTRARLSVLRFVPTGGT